MIRQPSWRGHRPWWRKRRWWSFGCRNLVTQKNYGEKLVVQHRLSNFSTVFKFCYVYCSCSYNLREQSAITSEHFSPWLTKASMIGLFLLRPCLAQRQSLEDVAGQLKLLPVQGSVGRHFSVEPLRLGVLWIGLFWDSGPRNWSSTPSVGGPSWSWTNQ